MAQRSDIHFQRGISLAKFNENYATEEKCTSALFRLKWPKGFRCPKCHHDQYIQLRCRPLFQCRKCRHQTSLLAGTIFSSTKLPLTTWFLAIFLVSQSKEGISSLNLRRFLDVSANAAMRLKHKIQMVMKKADDKRPLKNFVQIDDVYWGGKRSGGKRGRGAGGKTPFVAALQRNSQGHPLFIRFSRVGGFTAEEMMKWGKKHLSAKSLVVSDGLACFRSLSEIGQFHFSVKTTGRYDSPDFTFFDWLNTIIGNIKNALIGTYHGMDHRHLPRYLGEFCFRFNRRFKLGLLLKSLMYHAAHTTPVPERELRLAEDWW